VLNDFFKNVEGWHVLLVIDAEVEPQSAGKGLNLKFTKRKKQQYKNKKKTLGLSRAS
jgi:hypothetical protein